MPFQSFLNYLQLEKKYSLHTINAYRRDLEQFLNFYKVTFQIANINQANYSEIRSWVVNLVESGLTNQTINRKVSSLNTYYKFLVKVGEQEINPLTKHKALKTTKKVQIPFSESEIEMVLDNLNFDDSFESVRDRLIIELFYTTGIRRIELVQLQLKDIDLSNMMLKVLGKRNKERFLPILSALSQTIKTYYNKRNELEVIHDKDYVFLTKKGYKIYETLVYRIINDYFSKASTKVKKSPHILRHSFATHLLNKGADLNGVKELLGHAGLAATQVYTHNSIAKLKEVHTKSHPRNKK